MTPFQQVQAQIAPCNTLADLATIWQKNQSVLKAMPEADRMALAAMKDFYKAMIMRGEIGAYLRARAARNQN